MTPEKEISLFENVATIMAKLDGIDSKMDSFNGLFENHTAADDVNFRKISEDLDIIKLDKAKAAGISEEAAKHASSSGRTWGALSGGAISLAVAAVSAYFGWKP